MVHLCDIRLCSILLNEDDGFAYKLVTVLFVDLILGSL